MNITTPLLSLADVAIVGHIGSGGDMIGAVAVGGTAFNILYWIFAFLRMGTSGMTAQAYGARDNAEARRFLCRGMIVASFGAVLLLVLSPVAGPAVLGFIDGGDAVGSLAWRYFHIAILGAPGVLGIMVVSGWLLGMQRSRPIMWIALITNVINIILSVVFVFVFKMSIEGVALGTALAQLIGIVIGIAVVRRIVKLYPSDVWRNGLFDHRRWLAFFKINRDIFLRTICLASVTLWFTHAGAAIGVNELSANALLVQLFLVFSYFMDGFAFAGEALAGRFYGARQYKKLKETIKTLFVWGVSAALVFTALYFVGGDVFLTVLTDDRKIIDVAREYSVWAVLVPLAGFSAFTWDGVFIGMTRTRYLLTSMAVAMGVFFISWFGLGSSVEPRTSTAANHILWLSFVLYLAVRGVTSTVLYGRLRDEINS